MRDWTKIKNYYISHDISLEELAKKYKVPFGTLRTHCFKEKWREKKKETKIKIEAQTQQKIIEKEVDKKVKANEVHTELYDKGIEIINMLLNKYANDLKEGKKRTGATACNMDYLMSAVQKCQKGQRISLNLDDLPSGEVEPEIAVIEGLDMKKI